MAAPSRSINYRRGLSQDFVGFVESDMIDILAALKGLPDAANRDLRAVSEDIADRIMVPEIKAEIINHAGGYAAKLNKSVRARRDRIPNVVVGQGNRGARYSGGANTAMLRFGTIKGGYVSRSGKYQFWADSIDAAGWTQAASENYTDRAFRAWEKATDQIVQDWNRGKDY